MDTEICYRWTFDVNRTHCHRILLLSAECVASRCMLTCHLRYSRLNRNIILVGAAGESNV